MNNDSVSQDSLNMFMLGLVKVQGGSSPLLPNYDTLYIDAQKAMRAIEHVFAQASALCVCARACVCRCLCVRVLSNTSSRRQARIAWALLLLLCEVGFPSSC